jgi:hypothetical protein
MWLSARHLALSSLAFLLSAAGCADDNSKEVQASRRAEANVASTGLALAPSTDSLFNAYGFHLVPPQGWRSAPDSTVKRIQASLDPRLMNGHELIAILAPEGPPSWDGAQGVPTIRVLINPDVNTDPSDIVRQLRRAQPTLQVSTDSIADLTKFWTSVRLSNPVWEAPRNVLWTTARSMSELGTTVYTVGALRMYRGGQISFYFNSTDTIQTGTAHSLLRLLVDDLGIAPERDWR